MSTASNQVRLHDGASILADPLPEILTRDGFQTTSTAWHGIYYYQKIKFWNIIDNVRTWNSPKYLKNEPLSVDIASVSKQLGYIHKENYLCGDEQSVCGRFAQNALGPASAVAFHNGNHFRFGDYKVCQESRKDNSGLIPDHVAVTCSAASIKELGALPKDSRPKMVLVGEAKTPWKHNLKDYIEDYEDGDDVGLRRALGQIASYMHRFQMRYGFLTTYDQTIFVQQAIENDESLLYVSDPIMATSPGNKNVSVRQCLFYLLALINRTKEYRITNTFERIEWIGPKPTAGYLPGGMTTPITQNAPPPSPVLQMTPMGINSLSPAGPLVLMRNGSVFEAKLSFRKEHIREGTPGGGLFVELCGEMIRVTIQDGDHRGASGGGLSPSPPRNRPQGDASRTTVTFDRGTSHSRSQREDSAQRFEPSNLHQRTDMDAGGKCKGKARQSPDYSSPQRSESREPSQRDAHGYGGFGSQDSRDVYMQSPTPAPRSGRGTAYPPSSYRAGQQASRDLPYRLGNEAQSSRPESSKGGKSGSSNDPSKKPPRKK